LEISFVDILGPLSPNSVSVHSYLVVHPQTWINPTIVQGQQEMDNDGIDDPQNVCDVEVVLLKGLQPSWV